MTDETLAVVVELAEHLAKTDQVRLLEVDTGDRVTVSYRGLETGGEVGTMSLHWSGIHGVNTYPIILDGTGQTVNVHARYLRKE